MLRVFEISIDDIIIDPKAASERLNRTLIRGNGQLQVVGMCSDHQRIYLSLLPAAGGPVHAYRFAELCEFERDSVPTAMAERYYNGFITIGTFFTTQRIWALFYNDIPGQTRQETPQI